MTPYQSWFQSESRRQFLGRGVNAVGFAALASLLGEQTARADGDPTGLAAALPRTHFPAKAKHVIYLHMVGGPPQMDLYDYKPKMRRLVRPRSARFDPHGAAAHHHDLRPGSLSRSRRRSSSSPGTANAACG